MVKTTEKKEYKMKNILNQAGEFHFSQFDADNDNNADGGSVNDDVVVEEAEAGGPPPPPITTADTPPQIRHLIRLAYCNAVLQGLLLGSFAFLGVFAVTVDWQARLGMDVIARYLEQGYYLLKYDIQPQLRNVTDHLTWLEKMLFLNN